MARLVWTEEMTQFILDNYSSMDNEEIAKHLKLTREQIAKKACNLGLTTTGKKKKSSITRKEADEKETPLRADIICFYHRRGFTYNEIGVELNLSEEFVKGIVEACKEDGRYDWYAKRENGAMAERGYS